MKLGLKQGDYWKCKHVTVWTGFGSLTSEGENGVPRALLCILTFGRGLVRARDKS